ncbi:MAG: bifunctional adenosylcobinamide kinase/adenosylcobinamide-phosphate guanylyltransferase [Rhodobacteraceae bacterium]|nr:bifunctional adenosylcobinamide kinase/adenosylcobinamide-phosphate guanylyltransferase [Paracoccaceae bacterium]
MHPKLTLVLGGAASGKSAYAETLACQSGKDRVYLATSTAQDTEMQTRIARHIAQRGPGWTTIEEPLELAPTLSSLTADKICLIDCATLWLSNQMMAENDILTTQTALLQALKSCAAQCIIVTNEVGHGIVPGNALARTFREAQGRLNIALAARADLVVQVTVGLPAVLKGQQT